MSVRRLPVPVGGAGYDVVLGPGVLAQLGPLTAEIAPLLSPGRCVVVTDDGVGQHAHVDRACGSLRDAGFDIELVVVPAGEGSKSVAEAERLWSLFADAELGRDGVVVAVGGGMVGDLAGFCAATWKRGVHFVNVPTTVLAMADAAVGGKTAVNLVQGKNLVGAFHQPRLVVADVSTLATLPRRDIAAGLAEVVKCAVLAERAALGRLRSEAARLLDGDAEALSAAIALAIDVKTRHVVDDPHESAGVRVLLNLGHTTAHALETDSAYGELRHGEAVSIGLVVAARLGEALGHCGPALTAELVAVLAALELPTTLPARSPIDALLEHVRHDKKRAGTDTRMVLPLSDGGAEVFAVDDADLRAALSACL